MIGQIYNGQTPISAYQPPQDVIDVTADVQKDYALGMEILERGWNELNGRSVIEDTNRGQMMFNAFVDTSVEDPNEAWKWRGTRSMARNKGIAMHAQLTAHLLLPLFLAQNENDEEDQDISETMREIIEWMAEPTNSNYQSSFLQICFSMMYNPVSYMGAEYCEIMQKIKELTADGTKYETKEVLDEVLSGFKAPIFGPTEVLISNVMERNIQKHRRIIERQPKEYQEMEAKFGEHPNWAYVQEGIKSVFNTEDGLFYDIKDNDHPSLVMFETAKCRREDTEIPFVNGIYLGDADVSANPIRHRDYRDCPKYNIVPFGYMNIGDHFYFYKSMMNSLGWDNDAYDAMSEIIFNRAILENEMPVAISGTDEVDSAVIFPNNVLAIESENARITPLLPASNIAAGFSALRETEKSMSEGSVNDVTQGQLPDKDQKVANVERAQENAKKNIGAIGKSLAASVVQMGDLMKDIALNNVTVPEVEELLGGRQRLKYKTFILQNKKSGGKMGSKMIKFDQSLIGLELTKDEKENRELELLESTGYPYKNNSIRLINPEKFAKFRYLTKIDIEEMFKKGNEYWVDIIRGLMAELQNNPYINQLGLTRKLMYATFGSEGEELIKDESQMIPGLPAQGQQTTAQPINKAATIGR